MQNYSTTRLKYIIIFEEKNSTRSLKIEFEKAKRIAINLGRKTTSPQQRKNNIKLRDSRDEFAFGAEGKNNKIN